MKKLDLKVEELSVESFDTEANVSELRGTVKANGYTDPGYPSCDRTCGASPPPDTTICGAFRPTLQQACCL